MLEFKGLSSMGYFFLPFQTKRHIPLLEKLVWLLPVVTQHTLSRNDHTEPKLKESYLSDTPLRALKAEKGDQADRK